MVDDRFGWGAVDLARIAGVELDDWQVEALIEAMLVDDDGEWLFPLVCLAVSRQDGKGEILQARQLFGVIKLGELWGHTAQEFPTANDAFKRAFRTVSNSPLDAYMSNDRWGSGEKALEFGSDLQSLNYRSRTGKGLRGLTEIDGIVYDEAQHLTDDQVAAASPTQLVSPHPQTWAMGSGGLSISEKWWEWRRQALVVADGGRGEPMTGKIVARIEGEMLWIEYTAETITVGEGGRLDIVRPDIDDVDAHARANPAYPHRVTPRGLSKMRRELGSEGFMRECLGCWDPLPSFGGSQSKLSAHVWAAGVDDDSRIVSGHVFAVAVDMDQTRAAVYAGGRRADGARHKELLRVDDGTDWVERFLEAAILKNRPDSVCIDGSGPARALKATLERVCQAAGVKLVVLSLQDVASACEALVSGVKAGVSWHLGEPHTPRALKKASVRAVGKKWVWEWETAESVCVLGAATVADWCAESVPVSRSAYEDSGLLEV